LLVGVTFAKALALSLDIPMVEVHHMHAHVLAHFIEDPKPDFPFLCLTVSGGHTQIVKVNGPLDLQIIGTTIDDAAGEAFDKAGKMLGLDYPSGPILDQKAKDGAPVFSFTKPKIEGLDFSFSGLKTSILYFLQKEMKKDPQFINQNLNDLCCSIQVTIVDILIDKLRKAAIQENIKNIAIAGGVSANSALRTAVEELGKELEGNSYIPAFQFCTDNAGMIAMAAHFRYEAGLFASQNIKPDPRLAF
jgi:N6-L-threonylcarbamoyladenine synthase